MNVEAIRKTIQEHYKAKSAAQVDYAHGGSISEWCKVLGGVTATMRRHLRDMVDAGKWTEHRALRPAGMGRVRECAVFKSPDYDADEFKRLVESKGGSNGTGQGPDA